MHALATLVDNHPSARDEVITIASTIAEKASKGEKISVSNTSFLSSTEEGKKVIKEVEKVVSTYQPKTKIGK